MRLFVDCQRPLVERLGLPVSGQRSINDGDIVERTRDVGVITPEFLFPDRERTVVELFGVAIPGQAAVNSPQIVESRCHVGVVAPKRAFFNRQRAPIKRFGFTVLALPSLDDGQIVEKGGEAGMLAPQRPLPNRQGALIELRGFGVLALASVHVGQTAERHGIVDVIGSEPRLDRCFELAGFDERGGVVLRFIELVVAFQDRIEIVLLRARRRHAGRHDRMENRKECKQAAHGHAPRTHDAASLIVVHHIPVKDHSHMFTV